MLVTHDATMRTLSAKQESRCTCKSYHRVQTEPAHIRHVVHNWGAVVATWVSTAHLLLAALQDLVQSASDLAALVFVFSACLFYTAIPWRGLGQLPLANAWQCRQCGKTNKVCRSLSCCSVGKQLSSAAPFVFSSALLLQCYSAQRCCSSYIQLSSAVKSSYTLAQDDCLLGRSGVQGGPCSDPSWKISLFCAAQASSLAAVWQQGWHPYTSMCMCKQSYVQLRCLDRKDSTCFMDKRWQPGQPQLAT